MIAAAPSLVLAAASALVGLREERNGQSRGQLVDLMLTPFDDPTSAPIDSCMRWDTAFVHHVGTLSHFEAAHKVSSWPVPPCLTAAQLGAFAAKQHVIVDAPQPGDIFLVFGPARRGFVRSGIVERVHDEIEMGHGVVAFECITIEGDTDHAMAIGGGCILRHRRRLSVARQDAFVRWTELVRQAVHLKPAAQARLATPVLPRTPNLTNLVLAA